MNKKEINLSGLFGEQRREKVFNAFKKEISQMDCAKIDGFSFVSFDKNGDLIESTEFGSTAYNTMYQFKTLQKYLEANNQHPGDEPEGLSPYVIAALSISDAIDSPKIRKGLSGLIAKEQKTKESVELVNFIMKALMPNEK